MALGLKLGKLGEALFVQLINMCSKTFCLQNIEQAGISKIFLDVAACIVTHMIDLWYRQRSFFELLREINKRFIFFYIGSIRGYVVFGGRKYSKIMAIAPSLRQFIHASNWLIVVLLEKGNYLI